MENKQLNKEVKFGLKSFITICSILIAVVIAVGILTYVIPAGTYQYDENGTIIPNSFTLLEEGSRLPAYRWISAPVEALIIGEGNFNIIQIIVVLLILGGSFKVLDRSGGLYAVVQVIINRFYNKRYKLIWVVTLFMMLLASCFGLQEELLILFPIFLSFATAMGWSNTQAVSLILITSGVGFTTAIFNPFTVGMSAELAGVSILSGIWYRIGIFCLLYVLTSLYLVRMAKKDEKDGKNRIKQDFTALTEEERAIYGQKAKQVFTLFFTVLGVILVASAVPFIADLGIGMVLMALSFVVGAFIIGQKNLGSMKTALQAFCNGAKDLAPSIVIILLAFSVKYIAENGNILHTMFYYCHNFIAAQSPYVGVIMLYVLILVFEFFIPSSTAKAALLIPLLTLAPIPGISTNIIILAFLFGDGYANVLYPTCGTLVIGLGLAEVGYMQWLKRTVLFQVMLFVLSIAFLLLAVRIGL